MTAPFRRGFISMSSIIIPLTIGRSDDEPLIGAEVFRAAHTAVGTGDSAALSN